MTKKAKKKAMKTGNRTAMCSRLTTFSIGTDNPPDAKGKDIQNVNANVNVI